MKNDQSTSSNSPYIPIKTTYFYSDIPSCSLITYDYNQTFFIIDHSYIFSQSSDRLLLNQVDFLSIRLVRPDGTYYNWNYHD